MPTDSARPAHTQPVTIRPGAPEDAVFLAQFAARVFRETFGADNTPENMARFIEQTYTEPRMADALADPRMSTIFADVDGEVAGFAQVRAGHVPACVTTPAPIELERFYVDRPWHGRGVAHALMSAVDALAVTRGARSLWLGVWEHNHRAIAYYRKCGFIPVGSHVFVLGTDEQTDLLMVRLLPDVAVLEAKTTSPPAPSPEERG
jgi:ribosomal protein S18 acetylase RimI-like enzyme